MRSLLLIVCCFGVSIGTKPVEYVELFTDLVNSYTGLSLETRELGIPDEEYQQWDLLLSSRFAVTQESTVGELREEVNRLEYSVWQVIQGLTKLYHAELETQFERRQQISAVGHAWNRLLIRVERFRISVYGPKRTPPGRPGPPPPPPPPNEAKNESSEIDSENDNPRLTTISF